MSHTYGLCATRENAKQSMLGQVQGFARRHDARIIDRSDDAQRELEGLPPGIPEKTGGPLVLITIEKRNEFRISVTNLGLREKLALGTRTWTDDGVGAVAEFMEHVAQSWAVSRVEGGVENEPPCERPDSPAGSGP